MTDTTIVPDPLGAPAPAAPSVTDAFDQLRVALFDTETDDASIAAIDAMEAHFQSLFDTFEARLSIVERGVIGLAQGAVARKPIDPVRPGAGTVVTSPVPVAPMQQTDPSPATDLASAQNIEAAASDGTMAAVPVVEPGSGAAATPDQTVVAPTLDPAPLTPAAPATSGY